MLSINLPLSSLDHSPLNVRRTGGKSTAELEASIRSHGLLQNLTVRTGVGGRYEVIAGSRRLEALRQLATDSHIEPDYEVPCIVIASNLDSAAAEASLAENTVRERMHPHDEFVAFRELATEGRSVEEIAARFGVVPNTVERRLKLANVSPVLLDLFRQDQVTLDQMMALAITDDHAEQERAWNEGNDRWGRDARQLRSALTKTEVPTSDRRFKFVGAERFEAAGGVIHRDLFADDGAGYIADEALLDTLVGEVFRAEAAKVEAEGWQFVHIDTGDDTWRWRQQFDESEPKRQKRSLTEEEQTLLAASQQRLDAVNAEMEALDEAGGDADDYDKLDEEREALEDRVGELEAPIETWSDRQKAKAGAMVHMSSQGQLIVTRGLIPKQGSKADKAIAQSKGEAPLPKPSTLAESMIRRLTSHRTIALQSALLARADVALAALAHAMLLPLWFDSYEKDSALQIRATGNFDRGEKLGFQDVTDSPVHAKTAAAIAELRKTLGVPTRKAELLPWLLGQKREAITSLLAAVSVLTVSATQGNDEPHAADALCRALELDMADYWQPTAATFFTLVPKALSLEALEQAHGKEGGTVAAKLFAEPMPKPEFAGECERVMARTRWLPKPLRGVGYKVGAKAAPAAAAEAKTAPTKQAAKKAKPAAQAKKKPVAKKKAAPKKKAAKK